jgi:hypothetical protein
MGLLSGLSDFLFGIDPVSSDFEKQQMAKAGAEADAYKKREAEDYARSQDYIQRLWQVVTGNAPSAAQRSLVANADDINRGANSMVAGASGNNAAIARYGATQAAPDAMLKANRDAAILQATEAADATRQIGAAENALGSRSAGLYGTAAGIGRDYAGLATQIDMANQKAKAAAEGALLSTAGTLGAAAIGGPAGAAAAAPAVAAISPAMTQQQAPQLAMPASTFQTYSSSPGYSPSTPSYGDVGLSDPGVTYDPYGYSQGRRGSY